MDSDEEEPKETSNLLELNQREEFTDSENTTLHKRKSVLKIRSSVNIRELRDAQDDPNALKSPSKKPKLPPIFVTPPTTPTKNTMETELDEPIPFPQLRSPVKSKSASSSPMKRSYSAPDLDKQEEEIRKQEGAKDFEAIFTHKNRFTFWNTLSEEISGTFDIKESDLDEKREAVYNFVRVPLQLEKLLLLGFVLCLDTFLFLFTFMPIRFVISLSKLLMKPFIRMNLTSMNVWDLYRGFILIICTIGLLQIDASIVYHYIRGQAIIKLYVVFNVLEVFDKLCCSFAQDIYDSLFTRAIDKKSKDDISNRLSLHPFTIFLVALIYTFLHALVLFTQVITLNVAINSHNNALLTLLISNQFVELKGSVFKKFEKENLFQMSCSDMVERFQLSVFLVIITLHNMKDLQWNGYLSVANSNIIYNMILSIITVLLSETIVDWVKHAFITKFNHINPDIYRHFTTSLLSEVLDTSNKNSFMVDTHTISRRIAFIPIPLACVLLRIFPQVFIQFPNIWIAIITIGLLWLLFSFIKILLRFQLIKKSFHQYKHSLLNLSGETPSKVPNRFSIRKGKIP